MDKAKEGGGRYISPPNASVVNSVNCKFQYIMSWFQIFSGITKRVDIFFVSLLPTHGLVSGRYRSGMMQYQDLGLKLPGGLWAQPWRDHHHAFPYGGTLDLFKEP